MAKIDKTNRWYVDALDDTYRAVTLTGLDREEMLAVLEDVAARVRALPVKKVGR